MGHMSILGVVSDLGVLCILIFLFPSVLVKKCTLFSTFQPRLAVLIKAPSHPLPRIGIVTDFSHVRRMDG
jgi:hypothetical protein